MDSSQIEKLYKLVREKKDINDILLIDKDFILKLLDSPESCLSNDLDALKFLLEVRTVLICAKNMSIGNVYRFTKKDSSNNFEPDVA